MSQSFKLMLDGMRDNDPTQPESSNLSARNFEEFYAEAGHGRNLSFVWLDGKRIFVNYSYLVSCEYSPSENKIIIHFTSHTFTLWGVNLENLYYDIMHHKAKQITCVDERYNLIGENENAVVNRIESKVEGT